MCPTDRRTLRTASHRSGLRRRSAPGRCRGGSLLRQRRSGRRPHRHRPDGGRRRPKWSPVCLPSACLRRDRQRGNCYADEGLGPANFWEAPPVLRCHDGGMTDSPVLVERRGDVATITMDRPDRRNALSLDMLSGLTKAFRDVGGAHALGGVLAANGPVFSAGHDFRDVGGADHAAVRHLLQTCTELMDLVQQIPQPVVARVHGLATAAGGQLGAWCDLAVAAESAGFAAPGGKGGWFCHTPMVAIARNVGRKRAMGLALTGDVIDARTALDWGLVNRVVPDHELDTAVDDLMARATRGSRASKAWGKQTMYAQLDRPERDAYAIAVEVMASASQLPGAREGMAAFLEKRPPVWAD